ncbi:MAG: beta-1,3-glucanase family protein [Candidatus Xenobiia bacterium LiM19]
MSTKRTATLLLLAALMLCFALQGCSSSDSSDTAYWSGDSDTSTVYTVSGRIISPVSLQPIEGMTCGLQAVDGMKAKGTDQTTTTDSQGNYSFSGLAAGAYRMTTTMSGHITDNSYFTVSQNMTINQTSLKTDEWASVMGADHPYDASLAYVTAIVDHTGGGTPPVSGSASARDAGKDGVVVDISSNSKGKGSGYESRCYMNAQGTADWSATSTSSTGVALFYKASPADTYTMTATKSGHTFDDITDIAPIKGEFTNYMMNAKSAVTPLNISISNQSGKDAWVKSTGTVPIINETTAITSGQSRDFTLTSAENGRIYVSYGDKLETNEPDGANPGYNEHDYNLRFDKVELTYKYNSDWKMYAGKMNLTAVDHFAIPMILETSIEGIPIEHFSLQTGKTGTDLITTLEGVCGQSAIIRSDDGSQTLRILSPIKAPGAYDSYDDLLNALSGSGFSITGKYYGNPLQSYNYRGTFTGDSLTLSQDTNTIEITKDSLMSSQTDSIKHNGIYTCNGEYKVNGVVNHVDKNDIYAAVYRDLVTGFNLGFVNTGANDSSTWWTSNPFTGTYCNKYAKVINDVYPGAYGFPFSDRYKHVLADLGKSETGGIDKVTITLLADDTPVEEFHYQGNWNPQDGVTTFNMNINAGSQNTDFVNSTFSFNTKSYGGGHNYDWPSTTANDYGFTHPTTSADVSRVPAAEGLNIYDLTFSQKRHFLVLVKVENSQVKWASIAGGGGSRWVSPVLYVGSVLD